MVGNGVDADGFGGQSVYQGVRKVPECQRAKPFRDRFADFWMIDQTLARSQGILQEGFCNPFARMFNVVIDCSVRPELP